MNIIERRWRVPGAVPQQWQGVEVIAAASHPLGLKATAPTINELVFTGVDCSLFTSTESASTAEVFKFVVTPTTISTPTNRLSNSSTRRRIIMAAASDFPAMELELRVLEQADQRVDKVVLIEDGTSGLRPLLAAMRERGLPQADRMLLTTESSRRAYPEAEFGIPQERMAITGAPAFDHMKEIDSRRLNRETRNRLGLGLDVLVVAYFGIRSSDFDGAELRATAATSRAVAQLAGQQPRRVAFLHRRHPGDINPQSVNELLPTTSKKLTVLPYEQTLGIPSSNIVACADVNVAMLSTALTESALLGSRENFSFTRALLASILDTKKPARQGRTTGRTPVLLLNTDTIHILDHYHYELPSIFQLGAALAAYHNEDVVRTVATALFDPLSRFRLARQQATVLRREYAFDRPGSAAQVAVSELESLL